VVFSGEKLLAKRRTQKLLRTFRSLGVGSSMVEQLPFKQLVLGSNPSQPTMLRPPGFAWPAIDGSGRDNFRRILFFVCARQL
jgi:hypothetical protein